MDKKLIQRAIDGDKDSFEKLIVSRKAYLFKMAYKYTQNKDDALEIVGETVYRAFVSIKKLKEPSYFQTWLTRILINAAIDFRKKNPSLAELTDLCLPKTSNDEDNRIAELDLHQAIKELPEHYKKVVTLRFLKDFQIKKISKVLCLSEGTVKTQLTRALTRLRIKLIGQNGGGTNGKPIK